MKTLAVALLAGAAVLSAPAVQAKPKPTGEAKLAKLLEGRVAGEPVDCINTRLMRGSQIIDKTAIVYDRGTTIYVNRPTNPEFLDDDSIMVTRSYSSRLCSVDIVRLQDRTLFFPQGFVALQEFVPYTRIAED